jgi:hypothetical protein
LSRLAAILAAQIPLELKIMVCRPHKFSPAVKKLEKPADWTKCLDDFSKCCNSLIGNMEPGGGADQGKWSGYVLCLQLDRPPTERSQTAVFTIASIFERGRRGRGLQQKKS